MLEIYTDGASSSSLSFKPGGWAFVVPNSIEGLIHFEGGATETTNQRMEMYAMLKALEWLLNNGSKYTKIRITADSKYVLRGMEEHWYKFWEMNNWINTSGETAANLDLWKPLYELYLKTMSMYDIEYRHVRGHKGNMYNELTDKYAVKAKKQIIAENS